MIPVKILGRHIILDDIIWLSSSGSSVSFSFEHCTNGTIILHGDASVSAEGKPTTRARYLITFDGEPIYLGVLDAEEARFPLPLGTDSHAAICITKLSEASQSCLGVSFEGFDGTVTAAPAKSRRIEFIGDSITCGYGIAGNESMIYATAIEDIRKTYAWRIAEALDADANFTCFSGFGIVSGYTDDGVKNTAILVPDCYEHVGFCDQPIPGYQRVNDYDWDFSKFQPDQIVINLGTNDFSYTKDDPARQREYYEGYIAFLKTVRKRNPQARILCTLGLLGTILNDTLERAVAAYSAETGDQNILCHTVQAQLPQDGIVPDGHPTPVSNRKFAEQLLPCLK